MMLKAEQQVKYGVNEQRLVLDMGNPRVGFTLSLPISVHTRTHEAWVRIFTGLHLGTDKGMKPKGMGKVFFRNL